MMLQNVLINMYGLTARLFYFTTWQPAYEHV